MSTKVEHEAAGNPCKTCGLPAVRHRAKRNRSDYMRVWNKAHPRPKASLRIIGIDGEGQNIGPLVRWSERREGPHIYNYLAAADEHGKVWTLGKGPHDRLGTEDCLNFIVNLPRHSLVFGFAFLYDLTKILTDLPDTKLFLLFHEKKREYIEEGVIKIRPVHWRGFSLNYRNRRFTVARGKRSVTVWDVFAFFQSKFTKACIDWKIGNADTVASMEEMKERRSSFDAQSWDEIQSYCQTECLHLAQLGRQLLNAHIDAGFPLTEYYGAGSTAKALMTKYAVKEYLGEVPINAKEAIACAFFGGRFENSVIGAVTKPVWNLDISSAYPYAAYFLPCLSHGKWEYRTKGLESAIEKSRLALINWHLPRLTPDSKNCHNFYWGPLPVRKLDGSIAFPLGASSGWTWKEEFLAARRLRPDAIALGAWLYTSECDCQPFAFLADTYLERLKLGKDSKGIVLKLGPNSVYGKLVQSIGFKPPFQSWVWGGNITSNCRAQLLDAIRLAPSPSNVLMLATDGVWADAPINMPLPRDTGTFQAKDQDGKLKPLGGWEVKEYPSGVFAARPGIYFPLNPTDDDIKKVRARGLGRKILYEKHKMVIEGFLEGREGVRVSGGQRFIGAKTGLSWTPKGGVKRSRDYGEWIDWQSDISFDPRPKRAGIEEEGVYQPWRGKELCQLLPWSYFEAPSLPYSPAVKTEEDKLLELAKMIEEEMGMWETETMED